MLVQALLLLAPGRLAGRGEGGAPVFPPGARHAAYAALTQQALRHHGAELQLVALVGARFHARRGSGGANENERGGTFALSMDVRHFGAPSYMVQRVRATVRMLPPPPYPPGDHRVRGALAAARTDDKFRLLAFADAEADADADADDADAAAAT